MARLEPLLLAAVTDLERGLRTLGVPFAVVGALVPELLLDARPTRMTNDADAAVIVESLADFETLKDRLADFGFTRTAVTHRILHRTGGRVDLLPFSDTIAPDGRLELEGDRPINMAGFEHVVPSAIATAIDGGLTLPLIPLPLYGLLKVVAFNDRREPKDLAGVFHCLQHYLDDDERRYGAEHNGAGVPFEYTGAYLLGVAGRAFLSPALSETVTGVLNRFTDADADVVGVVLRERGWMLFEDEERLNVFEHFQWYRRGVGL
jgi:predicted nucleotidyltransferase